MTTLGDAAFMLVWRSRDGSQGIFQLLTESEDARVRSWIAASAERYVVDSDTEVDAAEWMMLSHIRAVTPAFVPTAIPNRVSPTRERRTPSLNEGKRSRLVGVDLKTDTLIANGFTVDGKVFSASDAAQLKWLGIYTSRAVLTYPLLAPTKDDMEFITLADADAVVVFYTAIVSHVQDKLVSGILLKQQIAAAANQAALDAVVDNRT